MTGPVQDTAECAASGAPVKGATASGAPVNGATASGASASGASASGAAASGARGAAHRLRASALVALAAALIALAPSSTRCDAHGADGPRFTVSFTEGARAEPFTGRVLVFLSKTAPEPRIEEPARPGPVLAADVVDLRPGENVDVGALAFPVPARELEGGRYLAQAVLDTDPLFPWPGLAPGNPVSAPFEVVLRRGGDERFELSCSRRIPRREIRETETTRLFELRSALLSEFHGRPVTLRALVHLPKAWFDEPERRFPLFVFLSGFGASLESFEAVDWPAPALDGVPAIAVYPDPSCPNGHSGFADSDNNGPYGSAFVRELLPAIEAEFRGHGEPGARLLAGHSSGAWSALWLLVEHPDSFGYAWAAAPDPVDFGDFMGIDLYRANANLFRDEHGLLRPFCRIGNVWTTSYMQEHSAREQVLRGGALGYFEALFGPRGADGRPVPLWDRETGDVDPEVAAAWSRFDLSRVLRERWDELGPKLDGKLSITMGEGDNFLLQGSVQRLARALDELGASARVRLVAGDHFSVLTREPRGEEIRALADAYRRWESARASEESRP